MRHRSGLIGSTCLLASFLALAQGCGASDSSGTDGADEYSGTDSSTPSEAGNPTDASVADSGPSCGAGLVRCGGTCIDPQTNSAYCGASADCAAPNAGTACTANYQTCSQGSCVPAPLTGTGTLADPYVIEKGFATCKAYKAAYGAAAPDGYYSVDPDGTGLIPLYCDQTQSGGGWTRCLEFVNTAAEDVTTNDWFDTCVTYANAAWQSGELLVDLRDTANTIQYSSTGQKSVSWTNDNITSTTTEPVKQWDSYNHDRLVTLANTDKLMITGRFSANRSCGGSIGDGYGIVLYPSEPDDNYNPKVFVIPYRNFNASPGDPRQFKPWTTDREIAWNSGASFDSCSDSNNGGAPSLPFLGKFEFFVR